MYDNMLKYFLNNNLISPKQSGFRRGISCVNKLLSISHDFFFTSFNNDLELAGVFLDISNACDNVWQDGLICKLKQNNIKDKLLSFNDFLKNHQYGVVLNGQLSVWKKLNASVPQGSISGPILLLIYINDLLNVLQFNPKFFVGNNSLFSTVQCITTNSVSLSHGHSKYLNG